MSSPILIVPGITNSGPEHWQTLWQQQDAAMVRVPFAEWDHPVCGDWVETIERSVRAMGPSVVIVAHSLGCLALAHWAAGSATPIAGAMLVCVPDPAGPIFPAEASGFAPVPRRAFGFPSLVVASEDDPYAGDSHTRDCVQAWGSRLVTVGRKGHINAGSGLGDWPEGRALLRQLIS